MTNIPRKCWCLYPIFPKVLIVHAVKSKKRKQDSSVLYPFEISNWEICAGWGFMWTSWMWRTWCESAGCMFGGWAGSATAVGIPACQHCPTLEAADTLQRWQNGSHLSRWATQSGAQQTRSNWDQSQYPVTCCIMSAMLAELSHVSFIHLSSGGGQRRAGRSGACS